MYMKRIPRKRYTPRPPKHEIICSACGAKDRVNFSPKETSPVLCRRCFRKKIREAKKRERSIISRSS